MQEYQEKLKQFQDVGGPAEAEEEARDDPCERGAGPARTTTKTITISL